MIRLLIRLFLACLFAGSLLRGQEVPLDAKDSSIKFIGHAFMHDFNGEARSFSGAVQLDSKTPEVVTGAKIIIHVAGMTTFETTRDKNMEAWLHADANPDIVFILDKVKLFAGEPEMATESNPARFIVQGDLQINRQQHAMKDMAEGWRSDSTIVVSGTTSINTEDYGLPQIRQFFLTVDKKVDITYRLVFDLPASFQLQPVK